MTAPDISPSVSHDEATKASLIRDPEFMWAYVCELRSALTANEKQVANLKIARDDAERRCSAVSQMYHAGVDGLASIAETHMSGQEAARTARNTLARMKA